MFRLFLGLTAIIIGFICIPAYADEPPPPDATTAAILPFHASLPLITYDGSSSSPTTADIGIQTVLVLVNQQRVAVGCQALTLDPQLTQAAQTQALDMAEHNYLGHTGTDGSDVSERVDRTGYPWQSVAENLSVGHDSAASAVLGWMGSSSHRANILDCTLRETGIAVVYLPNDTGATKWSFYWAEVFATR